MFTESSKPSSAKNASAAPPSRPSTTPSSPVSISVSRDGSPSPERTAETPIAMMTSRPVTSMSVRTTLALTDSPTPRKFTTAITVRNSSATRTTGSETNSAR